MALTHDPEFPGLELRVCDICDSIAESRIFRNDDAGLVLGPLMHAVSHTAGEAAEALEVCEHCAWPAWDDQFLVVNGQIRMTPETFKNQLMILAIAWTPAKSNEWADASLLCATTLALGLYTSRRAA